MQHLKASRKLFIVIAALLAVMLVVAACAQSPAAGDMNGEPAAAQDKEPAGARVQPVAADAVEIFKDPADIPNPVQRTAPDKVVVNLVTEEVQGILDDGSTYTYWTFNDTVPGPMIRVQEGDTVELHLKNSENSMNTHSIDLHAVNGPGGGAVATQVKPGEEKVFTFKAKNPGVYVYHCASPHIPSHIAMGMYGLIVVEPEGGLEPVDREFYIMQGEIYTKEAKGTEGHLSFDGTAMKMEEPNFVVFNGKVAALTGENAMRANVGEKVRLFVGNGGPNLISSFHVIGEVFDSVHPEGATESLSNIQTTLIPAGGATWVEFTIDVPGTYTLVDHAISRAIDKGAVAQIVAEGPEDPETFAIPEGQETSTH